MRKTLILAKTLLKGGGALTNKKKSKAAWVLPVVLGFSFVVFALSMTFLTMEIYSALEMGGVGDIILPMAFGMTSVVVFFFGIFYVVSTMYHATDIEMLLALPMRSHHILGAKFITLVIYEYIFEAFILVPLLVGYGIKAGVGVMYVIYSLLLFLVTPIIALSIAAIIVMIVMRFTRIGKNKQVFKFVGGLIAVLFAIGFNIAIQMGVSDIDQEQLIAIVNGEASLVSLVSNIFPGTIFAANTLIYSKTLLGLGSFVLFVLCCMAAIALFLGIGQLVYFKGVVGVTETSAKRRELNADALGKHVRSGSAAVSYLKKELRLIVRSPIAFMNCVLINILWPILLFTFMVTRGDSIDGIRGVVEGINDGTVIAIIVAVSAFVSSTGSVTSTAISREGKSLYFMKYIPMDIAAQLRAKVASGVTLSMISIVLLVAATVFIGVDIGIALAAFVLSLIANIAIAAAGMLIDASNPKLEWMNEQQAIKQNMNVLYHMLIGIAVAAAVIVPVLVLGFSTVIAITYMVALLLMLAFVLLGRVKNAAAGRIARMDV